MAEWRVGGKLKRTLYRDEQLVGLVDTAEIAAEIVETMNRVGRLLDEVRRESARERSPEPAECGCPITLETARVTRHSRDCSVRQAAERFEAGVEDERPAECCCAGCIGMGPCDDDLGRADDDASDDIGLPSGDCCDGEAGTPGVDCDCSWAGRP